MSKGYGRKKRKKKKSGMMTFLLLLFILAAAGYFGYQTLRVTRIEVEGNGAFTDEQIVELSGVSLDMHLLKVDPGQITLGIETNPYLVVTEIKRQWYPPLLRITVHEREIEAVIKIMDKQVCIDREGMVLEIAPETPLMANIEIIGTATSGNSRGQILGVQEGYQLEALKQVLSSVLEIDVEGYYTAIDISQPLDVRLHTNTSMIVRLGQVVDIDKKIELASETLRILYDKGYDRGMLDVTNGVDAAYLESPSAAKPQDSDDIYIPNESDGGDTQPQGDESD